MPCFSGENENDSVSEMSFVNIQTICKMCRLLSADEMMSIKPIIKFAHKNLLKFYETHLLKDYAHNKNNANEVEFYKSELKRIGSKYGNYV